MKGIGTFVVVLLFLTVPLAGIGFAQTGDDPLAGLKNACIQSSNDNPCEKAGVIQNQTVEDGETKTYEDGNFTAEGTVTVEDGGTVVVDNATITFKDGSDGFIVKSGGTLRITNSTFQEDAEGSDYGIDAQAGSTLALTTSTILGGSGVDLATSDAEVSANRFEEIPLALHLLDVTVNITGNHFVNNNVAVNETGGAPTLHQNLFEGGQICVQNWRTNPNITSNTFRGCHVGIYHKQSHSDILDNDMEDEIEPPGAGIIVEDTLSPNILNNRISRYGTGILVLDARAYIRGNTLFDNVAAGVRVVRNSAPMDITDNHIFGNGGEGILLEDTQDVELSGNDIHDNGGVGAHLIEAFGSRVVGNSFSNHAVQLNLSGGDPWVEANQFTGGEVCMRNWRTNPNITANTFRGCHIGIFHEQSHSDILDNDMEDEIEPPGAGIYVLDTESPRIEGNRIAKYGVGILIQDARAFVRDNTMTENVAAGVSVLRNSAPMDITDNHIFGNGGEGILLQDTRDVELSGNEIHDNGGVGAFLIESFGAEVRGNFFSNHTVQMNLTGGDPLVTANHFTGGEVCMRNWRTNPNITANTFRGCHIGIFHEQSHSDILDNDMEDEIEPPGAGIWVKDTLSPLIQNNRIAKYGVGVLIEDARGFVRNNTVSENVAAGVHVIRNSAPMDITGNHIFGNGGEGIVLEDTENVTVADNDVHDNGGTGAFASHTSGTLFSNNAFSNQTVQLNLTGIGAVGPVVEANSFSGGAFCIRNWQTNPSIIGNTMRSCHVGILHEQSHSDILDNDMEDEIEPPGAGIYVLDTESPVIENNRIAKYGVGVLVQDARAWIRNNTIHENLADGIRVVRNSAPMDIQGNDVYGNGGEGIALHDTEDVTVVANYIHDNAAGGLRTDRTVRTVVDANFVSSNVGRGVTSFDSSNLEIVDNIVHGHTNEGFFIWEAADGLLFARNIATSNSHGAALHTSGPSIVEDNEFRQNVNGFSMSPGDPDTMVRRNLAANNTAHGFTVRGLATMEANEARDNGGRGFDLTLVTSQGDRAIANGAGFFFGHGAEVVDAFAVGNTRGLHADPFGQADVAMGLSIERANLSENVIGLHLEGGAGDVTVVDSVLRDNLQNGALVRDSFDIEIRGTEISGTGHSDLLPGAVLVIATTGVNLTNITASDNEGPGFVMQDASEIHVTGSKIADSGGEGIVLRDTHDIEISGNDIHDNGGLGAHVIDAVGTRLIANSFANHTIQLNLTGAPAVPRIDEGSSPVAEPNLRRLALGVVESIADDCVVYDVQGDGVTNNDIRLTSCLGNAPGSVVTDADTAEKSAGTSTPGPDAFAFLYADVNANARYDLGDYVYLVVHESGNETPTELRAPSGGGGSFDYSIRLTSAGGHPAGSFVFAGDSDFVAFSNTVEPLPGEFGFSDHDESDAFGIWDDAFLTNGAVAPGGEVPANSVVLHGDDGFGTQTDPDEGGPLVQANSFSGGDFCIRNWRTNPTIVGNTFRGCHVGIFHEQSHSDILDNDMEDEIEPPGAGIWVFDTESPVIENNRIARYGVGILVEDARAFIRHNEILENVDDGIRVVRNSGPMDIQDNDIHDNGGNGIELQDAVDILVAGNALASNGGHGVKAADSNTLAFGGNTATGNARTGFMVFDSAKVSFSGEQASSNAEGGLAIHHVTGALIQDASATANGLGGFSITGNDVLLTRSVATLNDGMGFWVSGDSTDIHFSTNVARDNVGEGWRVHGSGVTLLGNEMAGNGLDGILADGTVGLELTANHASNNGRDGFRIRNAEGVESSDDVATANTQAGFHVEFSDLVTVTNITASGNQRGVWFAQGGTHQAIGGNASGNALEGWLVSSTTAHTIDVNLSFVRAFNNFAGVGVTLHSPNSTVEARDGWYQGNAHAGVRNAGTTANVTIDARDSYWGSPNGPTHPDNPGGDGDAVVGDVLFEPFRTSPPPEA